MTDQEKIYEVLGELLYAVAMADGVIQSQEKEAIEKLFKNHSWASEILWSFNYEETKKHSLEEVYKKVIDFCVNSGPRPEYEEFIEAMETVAKASDGIDSEESKVMDSFSKTLIEKFRADIENTKNQ